MNKNKKTAQEAADLALELNDMAIEGGICRWSADDLDYFTDEHVRHSDAILLEGLDFSELRSAVVADPVFVELMGRVSE